MKAGSRQRDVGREQAEGCRQEQAVNRAEGRDWQMSVGRKQAKKEGRKWEWREGKYKEMEGKGVKKKCVVRGGTDRRKRRKNSSMERKNKAKTNL
jgi:hypothetical protein